MQSVTLVALALILVVSVCSLVITAIELVSLKKLEWKLTVMEKKVSSLQPSLQKRALVDSSAINSSSNEPSSADIGRSGQKINGKRVVDDGLEKESSDVSPYVDPRPDALLPHGGGEVKIHVSGSPSKQELNRDVGAESHATFTVDKATNSIILH